MAYMKDGIRVIVLMEVGIRKQVCEWVLEMGTLVNG